MISDDELQRIYDVVVAGAGPAGSACATLLGRAGLRVLLCDRAFFPRHKICGETVNPRSWEFFESLGVADQVSSRLVNRILALSVTNSMGRETRVAIDQPTERPFFSMGRDVLDHILVQAAETAGVVFCDGAALTRAEWDGCWRIEIHDLRDERRIHLEALHLIGADGRNSLVAGALMRSHGSPDRIKRPDGAERVGVWWHAAPRPDLKGELCLYLFESGYCGLVDVDGLYTNVAMVIRPALAASVRFDFRRFLEMTLWSNPVAAARFTELSPIGEVTTTSPINPRRNHARHPCAALIGDARETVEPFTGEGIRYALEDGLAAAQLIIANRDGKCEQRSVGSGRFRVNRVFSPILRRPGIRDELISIAVRFPHLSRLAARTVLPGHSDKPR
jgi:flavin-dependent dehydrogenase